MCSARTQATIPSAHVSSRRKRGLRTPKADDRSKIALIYGQPRTGAVTRYRQANGFPHGVERAPTEYITRALEKMPPPEVVSAMRVAAS